MKNDKCEWLYTDYESGLTEDDWLRLLNEKDIFNENSLIVMACMKDNGGGATCAQLAAKYGRHFGFYNMTSSKLAKRVAKKTKCAIPNDNNAKYWPILYIGRYIEKGELGVFLWKLRDELSSALDKIDLSNVHLYKI